jgi:hypothetical protein
MSHLSPLHAVAAGLRALPEVAQPFAATQAAWRFYAHPEVTLPQLAGPLLEAARVGVAQACDRYALVVLDWSNLHYPLHTAKTDRVELSGPYDLGYELLTALVVSDRAGRPLAPVSLDLRAAAGVYTTRQAAVAQPVSSLDGLQPVMAQVAALGLGRPLVYVIDREADSVGHYRDWAAAGHTFLVRADDTRQVRQDGRETNLLTLAQGMARQGHLRPTREVRCHGEKAWQFVGETWVVLTRPARTHRVTGRGKQRKARHVNIPGPALPLRLIVSEVRDQTGRVLARWLLLSNVPAEVPAATLALWYYWRWEIESYHKLLKGAGLQVEAWLQHDAAAVSKRLTVAAMAAVVVWHLARDPRPEATPMRDALVRLSGRQIKRGKNRPTFTEPALLAGLGILLPMLCLLETYPLEDLRRLARATLPDFLLPPSLSPDPESG